MATINLRGYDIYFPYSVPYDIQKAYMEKVLTCLDQKTHAVLESPTGTGKTLCLFAPITAWARRKKLQVHIVANPQDEFNSPHFDQNNQQNPDQQGSWGNKRRSKIWYTARTHSQIAQTVGEVRKCNTEGLHVRVMGARDQLCINSAVLEEKDSYVKVDFSYRKEQYDEYFAEIECQTVKCKELVKNKNCKYYLKLSYEKDFPRYYPNGQVLDIEDLVSVGKSCGVCPYFLAKKACETADIVLLPYNYIIDKDSREANGIYLQNDVIIFDEGHNIPSTCEESFEFTFSSLDVAIGIRNIQDLMVSISQLSDTLVEEEDIDLKMHASNAIFIIKVLQKLETELEKLPTSNELLPVTALYSFFENAGVSQDTSRQLMDGIQEFKNSPNILTISGSTLETFKLLEKMMSVIFGPTVRSFSQDVIENSFKCSLIIDPERMNNIKKFSLYCFNPSFGIRSLLQMGVQSVIITSGTLSPLRTFISELDLPNPVTLENGHIAKKCQVPFVILGTGVNNVRMDGSYKNRNDPKYVFSLGMTLTNLISSIPDGVLLLFSSYTMMQNLKEAWESDLGIWTRLNALKRVFLEPRNKEEFINCMENYRRAIDSGNGAILMGVLRGKISEGMDFKDQYCRGVFIIGVPFPPVQDPRVKGKEKYAESLTVENPVTKLEEKLYNHSFMSVEAMKATNQAIGRVIRHGQDYGVIILVDYRFAWPRLFTNISSWLRGSTPVENNFPGTKKLVRDFFKSVHQGKLGFEETIYQRVDSNGCPIANYVAYEEYDHKKHASQPVAWIGATSENTLKSKTKVSRPRGASTVKFIDDDCAEDLVSKYKHFTPKPLKEEEKNRNPNNGGSLLDALESSMSSSVGYREFDKNSPPSSENGKRKYEDDEDGNQVSPSMLSYPEGEQKQKKVPRLKVRPLVPFGAQEVESQNSGLNEPSKPEARDGDDLKVKLVNYYRKVRQSLSKEGDEKFKTISCKYMKGEAGLTDVIQSMDELFLSPGNKNLFSGFEICVKTKDKDEWMRACRRRKVNVP